jgi:hypothetical protein
MKTGRGEGPGVPRVIQASGNRERSIIIVLAVAVALVVALYLGLRSSVVDTGESGSLLPYQMLVRDLVQSDQLVFNYLRQGLQEAEAGRSGTGRWPEPDLLRSLSSDTTRGDVSTPPFSYTWARTQKNIVVNYLGLPRGDVSAAAWLIRIQEPDPLVPTDKAPNDEEHHRLADGTVLHVSIWTHRFGGQVPPDFLVRPETAGWTQLLTAPLSPTVSSRK